MIGFIIYETVDILYTLGKLTYNGGKYVYNWYYPEPETEKITEIEISTINNNSNMFTLEDKEQLEKRISKLEKLLQEKNDN